MNAEIFGVVLYTLVAVAIGLVILFGVRALMWARGTELGQRLLGAIPQKRGKFETYECGVPLLGSSRERVSVKFYLVALFFVLFDIETVFLLPYAVAYRKLGMEGFFAVVCFVAVLGLGLLYILKRGALEWE